VSVQALVVDLQAPAAMRIAEVAEPAGGPAEVLIEVHHVSLNHGDLNDARSGRIPPGGVLGSDAAGAVTEPARGERLVERGADAVVVGLDGLDQPVDVVLDSVGGPQLVAAWRLLAPGGNLQSIGWTSGEPAVFPAYSTIGPPKSISSFLNLGDAAEDLSTLVRLVSDGSLSVEIGWRGPWKQFAEAVNLLGGRRLNGKALLDVHA
jgi:NADPH2:quinone reductase